MKYIITICMVFCFLGLVGCTSTGTYSGTSVPNYELPNNQVYSDPAGEALTEATVDLSLLALIFI